MEIEGVEVRGFRAIEVVQVPLSSLTVLFGENGAGKSSVIAALVDSFTHQEDEAAVLEDLMGGVTHPEVTWFLRLGAEEFDGTHDPSLASHIADALTRRETTRQTLPPGWTALPDPDDGIGMLSVDVAALFDRELDYNPSLNWHDRDIKPTATNDIDDAVAQLRAGLLADVSPQDQPLAFEFVSALLRQPLLGVSQLSIDLCINTSKTRLIQPLADQITSRTTLRDTWVGSAARAITSAGTPFLSLWRNPSFAAMALRDAFIGAPVQLQAESDEIAAEIEEAIPRLFRHVWSDALPWADRVEPWLAVNREESTAKVEPRAGLDGWCFGGSADLRG